MRYRFERLARLDQPDCPSEPRIAVPGLEGRTNSPVRPQAALPHISPSGSITFITAASSRLANPGTSGLAAINGALDRMTRTLARELASLRVNAVSPGVAETPWWDDKPRELFDAARQQAP